MVLNYLKQLDQKNISAGHDLIEANLKKRLAPEKFKNRTEVLAAESISHLCRQLVPDSDMSYQKMKVAIMEPFSLGYLSGFVLGVLDSAQDNEEAIKIQVLQCAMDLIFGSERKEAFEKILECHSSQDTDFKEGISDGLKAAAGNAQSGRKPDGLRTFMKNVCIV